MSDITLKMVLDHIVQMESRILGRLEPRIENIEKKLSLVEQNIVNQIDGVDKRLDEIELEEVSRRLKVVERNVGIV